MKVLTHGSLSTGICGFDIGAEQNKIKTRWTCEIDELRRDFIKYALPKARHYGDMRKVKKPVYVDIISFGFPCQDISRANPHGKGIEGEKSGLWYEGWRIIRRVGPRYIILENSPDLVHKGLRAILGALAEAGYNAEWYIISCKRFGLPHIRERLFIVAYSKKVRVDSIKILRECPIEEHRSEETETVDEIPLWFRSDRIHSTALWIEMLAKFRRMDNGIPRNISEGLLAAAGDTVSPRITAWIFSRIKTIEKAKIKE